MKTVKEVTKPFSALNEMVFEGDVAMFTTSSGDGSIRSRPMATSVVTKDGELIFFSTLDTELMDEIKVDNQVNLTYRHTSHEDYVSISGVIEANRDTETMQQFWKQEFEQWIPDGLDNPRTVLLRVTPLHAEHWGRVDERKRLGRLFIYGRNEPDLVYEKMGVR